MKLVLLRHTPDPDLLVALAARRCYSCRTAEAIEERLSEIEIDQLLEKLRLRNHLSPFEHASFTFSVDGVSRALSHQLVRHRIASYSQESQRYVEYTKLRELPYIIPPTIAANPEAAKRFADVTEEALKGYRELLEIGVPAEDARYLFPNAVETKLVYTMNARSLFNFFEQRCCRKAQWEIRLLAEAMLREVRKAAPRIFHHAGAPCHDKERPYCRENDSSCPNYRLVERRMKPEKDDGTGSV
ncbi:MAG TPA: FAD-dependent thymidylate synthase [Candidatus Ozemobacteraceae bacterium]|nr:FAD-dependent thymidylate synthase [Candidatus Ozemobacteraceae bacterium]